MYLIATFGWEYKGVVSGSDFSLKNVFYGENMELKVKKENRLHIKLYFESQ